MSWKSAFGRAFFAPVLAVAAVLVAGAQTPAARVQGTVSAVDAAAKQIVVKTDAGETVTLTTTEHSFFRRMPPGETDAKKATPIVIGDIQAGDRMVAAGQPSADPKIFAARTILIMSRTDVAEVHAQEEADWQKRGATGIVVAIDPAAKTFRIKTGQKEVTVQPSAKTEYLRYGLESNKLADAKPSAFDQVKTGDEMHVLGNKDAEGQTITAEKIVSGSFKQIAATIQSIDGETGLMKVKDLATKKIVLIHITPDSTMRKLPEQMAAMMAHRYGAAADGRGAGAGSPGGERPAGTWNGNGANGRGGAGGRPPLKQLLDRLPPATLAELKPGDAIMVTTTEGTDVSHSTAIMLLAGVEPLLAASPASTRDIMSGWNLGGGGEGESN